MATAPDLAHASLRHMMTAVLAVLPREPAGTPEDHETQRQAAVALLGALQPTDPVQHMFAAHVAAAHFAAMDFYCRASLPDQSDETSGRLTQTAAAMVRLTARSLDHLKRAQHYPQTRPSGDRRPSANGLTAAIAQSGRQDPMPREKPAAAAPVEASLSPRPQPEIRRQDPMPSEPFPTDATEFPFDRAAWIEAVRAMSPRAQATLANRIRTGRNEPPLPS